MRAALAESWLPVCSTPPTRPCPSCLAQPRWQLPGEEAYTLRCWNALHRPWLTSRLHNSRFLLGKNFGTSTSIATNTTSRLDHVSRRSRRSTTTNLPYKTSTPTTGCGKCAPHPTTCATRVCGDTEEERVGPSQTTFLNHQLNRTDAAPKVTHTRNRLQPRRIHTTNTRGLVVLTGRQQRKRQPRGRAWRHGQSPPHDGSHCDATRTAGRRCRWRRQRVTRGASGPAKQCNVGWRRQWA